MVISFCTTQFSFKPKSLPKLNADIIVHALFVQVTTLGFCQGPFANNFLTKLELLRPNNSVRHLGLESQRDLNLIMPSHLFSTNILGALCQHISYMEAEVYNEKKIALEKRLTFEDVAWAEAMMKKHCRANDEIPVVILTEEETAQARDYLARYGEIGVDIADEATKFFYCNYAAKIRDFLKTMDNDRPGNEVWTTAEGFLDICGALPKDNGAPKCFNEWFALMQVWRLSLGVTGIPFEAVNGTFELYLEHLPKSWEDKLDECMQFTHPSAAIPGLFVTREDLNSILHTWDSNPFLSGLVTGAIIDR